jgi:type II secretion system protein H
MTPSCKRQLRFRGFTLIELILVLALLAIIMALSAPMLSRSLRQRGVDQEASRFLALLEYGRSEAVSQGVPMMIWLAPTTGRYGVEAKAGFAGNSTRVRTYTVAKGVTVTAEQGVTANGVLQAVEFAPDGWPVEGGAETVRFSDSNGSAIAVTHTTDRWGYELTREEG